MSGKGIYFKIISKLLLILLPPLPPAPPPQHILNICYSYYSSRIFVLIAPALFLFASGGVCCSCRCYFVVMIPSTISLLQVLLLLVISLFVTIIVTHFFIIPSGSFLVDIITNAS